MTVKKLKLLTKLLLEYHAEYWNDENASDKNAILSAIYEVNSRVEELTTTPKELEERLLVIKEIKDLLDNSSKS